MTSERYTLQGLSRNMLSCSLQSVAKIPCILTQWECFHNYHMMHAYLHVESVHVYSLHLLIHCVHSTKSTKRLESICACVL